MEKKQKHDSGPNFTNIFVYDESKAEQLTQIVKEKLSLKKKI